MALQIQIPQRRALPQVQAPKQNIPLEQMIQAQSQSSLAHGISSAGQVLGQALQKRAETIQQAKMVNALAQSAGETPPAADSEVSPDTYMNLLKIQGDRRQKVSEAAKNRVELELRLEAARKGYVEHDPSTGVTKTYPGVQGIEIKYDAQGNPFITRGLDYAPGQTPKIAGGGGGGGTKGDPLKELQTDLDPANPKSGMSKQSDRMNSADRVLALLDQSGGNPNILQSREAAAAVASLVQGGSSGRVAQEQLDHLTPKSLKGDLMAQLGYIANQPVGLGQQEFFKSLRGTAEREKSVVQEQIKNAQISRLARHERTRQLFPEGYNATLLNYGLDPTKVKGGRYVDTPKAAGLSPEAQALINKHK